MKKFMKKLGLVVTVVAVAITSVIGLAACGQQDKGNYLMVATNAQFEPFEYYNGSNIVGVDVDIINALAKQMGYDGAKMVDMEFDSIVGSIATGTYQLGMAGMTVTEKRKKSVNFTNTYFDATQVVIYKGEEKTFGSEDALWDFLKGKKIGVALGFTGDIMIGNNLSIDADDETAGDQNGKLYGTGATKIQLNNGALAVQELINGNIDVVVIDQEPAIKLAEKFANSGVKVSAQGIGEEKYAIAVNKKNPELLKQLNVAMDAIKANGEFQNIMDKWFGSAK